MISFRTDTREAEEVRRWAERLGVERSELLRRAVHQYLIALRSQVDAATWERVPSTASETALAEVADWGPAEDWSDWADATG